MSDLLNIGASGVRAYQSALTTVSENIANANTAGYARRTTDLKEVLATGGGLAHRVVAEGNGVVVAGVSRAADAFRAANVRASNAELARSETGIDTLDRVETALTGNQLGTRLTNFFDATRAVAADPTAAVPRSTLLEAATSIAAAFAATGKALEQVARELDDTAESAAASLDSLGTAIAQVNDGLGRTAPGTSAAAQLLDQRDALLEQMSAISDVSVSTDAAGRATVRLGAPNGPVFVAGRDAGNLTYVQNDAGVVSFAVHRAGEIIGITPSGGALAGIADGAQRIADARRQLNDIVGTFTAGVNAVQAQGRNLDGQPGAALFAVGASASDITLTLGDPRGIAAASVGGGPRDNSNLKLLDNLRATGAFETKTTALVAGNAASLASRKQVAAAQSSIRDGALAARDAGSGVNLDAEAVDLLRFQQAYQASSRVIQVARETFQSILDIR